MNVGFMERLVQVLAGLAILFVGGTVAVTTVMPIRSGIQKVAVDSEIATSDWLERKRTGRGPGGPAIVDLIQLPTPAPSRPQAPAQPGQPQPQANAQQPAASSSGGGTQTYFDSSERIPQAEQVPGVPWLRRMPNTSYARPKAVPQMLYQKYQSFEDTWNLVQEGGGEFVSSSKGDQAYQVNWLDKNSYLFSRIGLRQGDKVISVNGQPIGSSVGAGKAMYEQLKGEKRFAVLIERDGQQMVLSFYVN